MSDLRRTTATRVDFPSTTTLLAEKGIRLFDAPTAQRMMLAASLGLMPDAWQWTINRAVAKNMKRHAWETFDYDYYVQSGRAGHYGWPVPPQVARRVDDIRRIVPTAKIDVLALVRDDPMIRVSAFGQQHFAAGWYHRHGRTPRVYLP